MEAIGPKSTKLLKEIEDLEATRAKVAEEESGLAQAVAERQSKLDVARAQGLVGKVDQDQVRAFESELETFRANLAKAHSTLAGLDQMLTEKRQALEEAKVTDAREALTTGEMSAASRGLERNAKALEKARAAFLKALEAGAAGLLEVIAPYWREWEGLLEERKQLHAQRCKALGRSATFADDPYYKMLKDPIASHPFGDPEEIPRAVELARLLKPLLPKK